jgi:hypothetical protein
LVLKRTGNVGIGVESPDKKLEVFGDIKISGGDYKGLFFENASGTTKTLLYQHASYDALVIKDIVNNADRVTFKNNGNVGIGTTSPGAKLHVSSGTANEDCVVIIESDTDNNDETSNPRLELKQDGGAVIGRLGYRNNTNSLELINQYAEALYLGTNNSTDLTILSNGNVGIGTTSPSQKLHVNGATQVDNGGLLLGGTSSVNGNNPQLRRANSSNDLRIATAGSDRMTILGTGNVGIGTTSPSEKLHVYNGSAYITPIAYAANQNDWVIRTGAYNNTAFDQGLKIKSTSGGSSYMAFETAHGGGETMVLRSGQVGIGLDNPGQKLSVAPSTDVSGEFGYAHVGNVGYNGYAGFSHVNLNSQGNYALLQESSGTTFLNASNGQSIRFRINNSDKMILDSSGRFGIGTTSPAYQLDVSGTGRFTSTVTATNFILSSDKRNKTKIKDLTCDNIDVNWKSFELKENEGEYRTGVIAQELEKVHPEFVNTDKEGFKSVKYIDLLIAKIAELEARLEKLEK